MTRSLLHLTAILSALSVPTGMTISSLFVRECGNPKACNLAGSLTMPNARVLNNATCCSRDLCTPETPAVPADSEGPNGVTCMACMSTTELPCRSDKYMDCVGKETKCYSQVQKTRGGSGTAAAAVRGCATPEMCLVPTTEMALGDSVITAEVACFDGCSTLHHSLSLIVLCMILITKLLH
ncbi:phospholipase A2 inhibitor and Ly6/PLAUR domain-containing protein-like isoform X2 [Hyperolius riggenbachi]|uniref:phospholipase A2 inhibitor and Ly6/PLAUR domain-containing protein-like isoform X2 n=1 Tax=Hyperolius riggenbachi TaxID=752182 RepID=UPI0035A38BBD